MSAASRLLAKLRVPGEATSYINHDILPLPPSRRTWSARTFVWFWLGTSVNVGGWASAAAGLALGLNVWQACLVDLIGSSIICLCLVANGMGGAKWHVPFAVLNRTAWGIRGTWFPLANRIILSCVWYGVQAWYGGACLKVMIGAIWPSYYNWNTLPDSAHMTSSDFLSFFLFWLISLPLIAIKPERYKYPALFASVCMTVTVFAIMIWALAKAHGPGKLIHSAPDVYGVSPKRGSELGWVMLRCITSTIGSWAGAILYQNDWSRFSMRPHDQVWGQVFVMPVCLVVGSVFGTVTTSCATVFYPHEKLLWRPYDLLAAIQRNEGTSGARAAVFFAAFSFFLVQFTLNISGNAIIGGIDLSGLLPKYIDVRRGSYLIALIGLCINPWELLYTANTFISVLGSYATILSPLTGIMIMDYQMVRCRRVKLTHLYLADASSHYFYWHGINWRAPVAWVIGVFPSMPGFAAAVSGGRVTVTQGWMRVNYISYVVGFSIASVVYLAMNWIWPPLGRGEVDDEDVYGTFTEREDVEAVIEEEEKEGSDAVKVQ